LLFLSSLDFVKHYTIMKLFVEKNRVVVLPGLARRFTILLVYYIIGRSGGFLSGAAL